MNRTQLFRSAILSLLFITPFVLQAQIESDITSRMAGSATAAYYYVAKPGELTIQVNLWGAVARPGRYEVSNKTDLIQLLSFAGGPLNNAKLSEIRVTRLSGRDSETTRQSFFVSLDDLDKVNEEEIRLLPGDTIFIDTTPWADVLSWLSVLATVATLTYAIVRIIVVAN